MAKVWDKPITAETDWGGDASTDNLPVSGRQVQAWIKGNIKSDAQISQLLVSWLNTHTINSPVFWKGLPIDADTLSWDGDKLTVIGSDGESQPIDEQFLINFLQENGYLTKGDYPFVYDAEKKAWLFTGDLVATGAITMFGDFNNFKPSTIMDAVQVDDITIGKTAEGVLYAKGGGGSGGSGLSYEEINQIVSNAIQNKADKATTLEGYGIEDAYDKSYIDTLAYKLTTVYNWGDHSKAGYVFKDTKQDISARHNFTNGIEIGGLAAYKSKDDVVFLDANLVVRGAIAMYGDNGTTSKTIWENIPFDSTMEWKNGMWSVVGGAGGVDTNAVNTLINEALVGYATQSWVQSQGYLTQHQSLSHLLSKTDAANTYLAKSGGSVSSDDYMPLFVNSNYSSGVEDVRIAIAHNWNVKGLFNWASNGVGLRMYNAVCGSAIGIKDDGTPYYDSWNLLHSGNIDSYNAGSATKLQTARSIWGQPFNGTDNIGYDGKSQWLFMNYNGEGIYITDDSISWHDSSNAWAKGLLGFAADGTVRASNKLAVGRTTADYTIHIDGITKTRGFLSDSIAIETNSSGAMGSNGGEINRANGILYLQYDNSNGVSLCYGGGNVAVGRTTADAKLHVGGSIRADYDIVSIGVNRSGGGFNLSDTGETYCGLMPNRLITSSGQVTDMWLYNNTKISYYASAHEIINDVTINGNLLTTGAITMFSQASLKNIVDERGLSLEELAKIKPVRFTWKDGRDDRVHAGAIADNVLPVLPEVVYKTNDGKLTFDYGSGAWFVGTSLIKPVVELWDAKDNHEKRITDLENENKRKDEIIISLQNQLKQLTA